MGLDFFTVKFANKRGKADVSKVLTSKSKASNSDFAHEILSKISSGFEASLGSAKKDLNLSMLSIPIDCAIDSYFRWAFKCVVQKSRRRKKIKRSFIKK